MASMEREMKEDEASQHCTWCACCLHARLPSLLKRSWTFLWQPPEAGPVLRRARQAGGAYKTLQAGSVDVDKQWSLAALQVELPLQLSTPQLVG